MLKKYLKHFQSFLEELNLSTNQEYIIGVSGGVDSMVLLSLMHSLGYNIKAVHINHNTRGQENIEEQNMIFNYCQKYEIPLDIFNFHYSGKGNFEMEARKFRYNCFNVSGKILLTAHHIDDSFEWYLMQEFKSSTKSYGIPVKNGDTYRPLMCFTKEQIHKIAQIDNIPFLNDSSNKDLSYERNYVRNIIVPSIKKRYPNYLKHYVNKMNNLTKKERIHISSLIKNKKQKLSIFSSYEEIEQEIRKKSSSKRGKISNNLNSLLRAISNGKRNFTMDFSGNVKVIVEKNNLKVINKKGQ